MSECVVRMEMPKACSWIENGEKKKCPTSEWGGACAVTKQFKMPDDCRPSWCPIICSLPEGHGRLVDADELSKYWKCRIALMNSCSGKRCILESVEVSTLKSCIEDIGNSKTIVPAEAERSET